MKKYEQRILANGLRHYLTNLEKKYENLGRKPDDEEQTEIDTIVRLGKELNPKMKWETNLI